MAQTRGRDATLGTRRPARCFRVVRLALVERFDLLSLGPFFSLDDFELNPLPLAERPVSLSDNRSLVDEDVYAVVGSDEAKPLCVVKPLYCARCHEMSTSLRQGSDPGETNVVSA